MADAKEIFSDEEMLLFVLVLAGLRYPGLQGRRNDANKSANTRKRNDFLFFCLRRPGFIHVGLLCLCLCLTCKLALKRKDETREFASTRVGMERLVLIQATLVSSPLAIVTPCLGPTLWRRLPRGTRSASILSQFKKLVRQMDLSNLISNECGPNCFLCNSWRQGVPYF